MLILELDKKPFKVFIKFCTRQRSVRMHDASVRSTRISR